MKTLYTGISIHVESKFAMFWVICEPKLSCPLASGVVFQVVLELQQAGDRYVIVHCGCF